MHQHSHSAHADRFHKVIHFDEWAKNYDASPLQFLLFAPTHVAVIEAALDVGARPKDILDLGCGTGRLLQRAADTWPTATFIGVDAASVMVDQARRAREGDDRFLFEVGDAAAIPFEDACVDLVFSTISFHHWADQRGGVREAARVLRPGGLFVLADFRPPLLLRPILRALHSSRSRRSMLRDANLNVIAERRPLRLGAGVLITVARKG
jgi:ubiquinone/menaquinone biosynthesis C-methylase UbiE